MPTLVVGMFSRENRCMATRAWPWHPLHQRRNRSKLPHVSGAAVVRALERLGFQRLRQSGSHVILLILRRGSKGCVVPMQNEVKVGTLAGVLRQADVSPDEFIAVL